MGDDTAKRVTAMLHAKAVEPVEQLVRTLALIKVPPALRAIVLEHMARLALEAAAQFRSKPEERVRVERIERGS